MSLQLLNLFMLQKTGRGMFTQLGETSVIDVWPHTGRKGLDTKRISIGYFNHPPTVQKEMKQFPLSSWAKPNWLRKERKNMSAWGAIGKSDEWYTPKYIFDSLGINFDMDVAAPKHRIYCHVPANEFITELSLLQPWSGFVWMNPPFGGRNGIQDWLNKLAIHGDGIALTPDRTSAPWWQEAAKKCDALLFVAGKIKFIKPEWIFRQTTWQWNNIIRLRS